MQNAVNVIIDKANEIKSKADETRVIELSRVQSKYDESMKEYKSLVDAAKQVCDHPYERIESFEDGHRRETICYVYCKVCGKYLRGG